MRKTVSIAVSFLLCILGLLVVFTNDTINVGASVVKTVEIDDNFDAPQIDSVWNIGEDAAHLNKNSVLRFTNANLWNNAVNLQAVQLTGACTISFNASFVTGSSWLGLLFGVKAQGGEMRFADSALILQDTVTLEYHNKGNEVSDEVITYDNLDNGMKIALTGVVSIKVDLAPDTDANDGTYTAQLYYKEASAQGEFTRCDKTFKGINIGPYFGLASMGGEPFILDIMDFKITNADQTVLFADDFNSGSISYPSAVSDSANWNVAGQYDSSKIFCGALKTIGFNGKNNAVLLSNVSLLANPDSKRSFSASYDMFLTSLAGGGLFGVGFNLTDTGEALDRNVMVGIMRRENDYAIVKSANGVVTEGAAVNAELVEKGDKIAVGVTVEGYYDRSVSVTFAGVSHTFEGVAFDGAFGVGVTKAGTESKAEIDNFFLQTYSFATSQAPDLSVNFKGVRTWEDMGDTYTELYLNENDWLKSGNGVKLGDSGDNCINFISARENVLFGPRRQQYSDVIIRFDVRATASGASLEDYCGIGVTVGRKNALSTYGEGANMFLGSYAGQTWIRGTNLTDTQSLGKNIFADTKTWYNVMFVISDNSVSLYYKAATDPVSEMGILRGRINDINTYGYAAIACSTQNNKANNFSITNVSFTNLEV